MGSLGEALVKLRERFIEGKEGNCSLVFTKNGQEIYSKRCDRLILEQIDYFKSQENFAEGKGSDYVVDISQFYVDGCSLSPGEFVHATFSGQVGPDDGFDKCNIATRYAIVKLRDYLGMAYDRVFKDNVEKTKSMFRAELRQQGDVERVHKILTSMIGDTRGNNLMSDLTIKHDLQYFYIGKHIPGGYWKCAWAILQDLALDEENKDRCRKICLHLCADFSKVAPRFNIDSYIAHNFAFGSSVFDCVKMCFKLIGPRRSGSPRRSGEYPSGLFESLQKGHDLFLARAGDIQTFVTNAIPVPEFGSVTFQPFPYVSEKAKISSGDCGYELAAKRTVLEWTRQYFAKAVVKLVGQNGNNIRDIQDFGEWMDGSISVILDDIFEEMYRRSCIE